MMTRKAMKLIRITMNTENMEGGGDRGAGKGGGDTDGNNSVVQ